MFHIQIPKNMLYLTFNTLFLSKLVWPTKYLASIPHFLKITSLQFEIYFKITCKCSIESVSKRSLSTFKRVNGCDSMVFLFPFFWLFSTKFVCYLFVRRSWWTLSEEGGWINTLISLITLGEEMFWGPTFRGFEYSRTRKPSRTENNKGEQSYIQRYTSLGFCRWT
jgi:hypothetical protein